MPHTLGTHRAEPPRPSGAGPSRALRYARLAYYAVYAPVFLYSMYVQLIVLKGPGRTPIPASVNFGRDSVFLTFHGNFHCTWYACLCLLNAFLTLDPARHSRRPNGRRRDRSSIAVTVERTVHRWTGPLFPLASFVGLAYYLILHFHPLTRLRARTVPDYDEKMALLHLVPLLFVLGDSLLKDEELIRKHGMSKSRATRTICAYGVMYFAWSCFCVSQNGGHWPYPFQPQFSAIQHLTFVSTVLLVAAYLTKFGYRIQARLDKRRRRRLAYEAKTRGISVGRVA